MLHYVALFFRILVVFLTLSEQRGERVRSALRNCAMSAAAAALSRCSFYRTAITEVVHCSFFLVTLQTVRVG